MVLVVGFRWGNIDLAQVSEYIEQAEKAQKVEVGTIVGVRVVGSVEGYGESLGYNTQGGVPSYCMGVIEDS